MSPVGGVGSVPGSQPGSPGSAAHLLLSEAEDERAYYTEVKDYLDNAFASLADELSQLERGQDEALVGSSIRFASLRPVILTGAELFQHVRKKAFHWRAEGSTSDRLFVEGFAPKVIGESGRLSALPAGSASSARLANL